MRLHCPIVIGVTFSFRLIEFDPYEIEPLFVRVGIDAQEMDGEFAKTLAG
jgi:hypothetical protein